MWGLLFSTLRRANFSRSYENFLRVMVIMVTVVSFWPLFAKCLEQAQAKLPIKKMPFR